jgi:hypothetical protein
LRWARGEVKLPSLHGARIVPYRRAMRLLLALLLLAAAPAQAEAWRATYAITVAGAVVMEAEVAFDLGGATYRVEARTRTRGLASLLVRGESLTLSEGSWQGGQARPRVYETQGHWRGTARRARLEYGADGEPQVLVMEPAQDMARSPLPAGPRAGTLDNLSALAQLVRHVRDTGRCDTGATGFDGRRLTRFEVTRDPVVPAADRGLLRCVIESQPLAGYALDRPEAANPTHVHAVFGVLRPDTLVLPVRVEIASRWWGRIEATLMSVSRG